MPEEWLNDIVVLSVETGHLDKVLLQPDRNVRLARGEQLLSRAKRRAVLWGF